MDESTICPECRWKKQAYHMIRLLEDGYQVAVGNHPVIFKTGEERDLLLSIRQGNLTKDQVVRLAESRIKRIDDVKPWPLPEEGDKEFLNEWLFNIRISGLRKEFIDGTKI